MTPPASAESDRPRFQVIPALAKLLLRDLQSFGRFSVVLPRKPTPEEMMAFARPRVRLLELLLKAMEHFGDDRLAAWRLPYCYMRIDWPEGQPVAGYTEAQRPDTTVFLRSLISNWHLEMSGGLNHRLRPAALWMTHQHGLPSAVDYLLDLLDHGFVVESQSVAAALAWLLPICGSDGSDRDKVERFLGGRVPPPSAWMDAVPEPSSDSPRAPIEPEVAQRVLWRIVQRCLGTAQAVRKSRSWDGWALGQARISGLAETAVRTGREITPSPPLALRAVLSQLEEMVADAGALFLTLEDYRPFEGNWIVGQAMRKVMQLTLGENWRERLLEERLLVPSELGSRLLEEREPVLPPRWQRLTWRLAVPFARALHLSRTVPLVRVGQPDLSELVEHGPLRQLLLSHGVESREEQEAIVREELAGGYYGEVKLDPQALKQALVAAMDEINQKELTERYLVSDPDSSPDELRQVAARTEELLTLYPWHWLLHEEMGIALDLLDAPHAALRHFVAAMLLRPDSEMPWQSLVVALKRLGLAADTVVARVVRDYVQDGGLEAE